MSQNKEPIILCHAACTGGSLIYRLLASTFDFLGVSEISHVVNFSPKKYLPLDPESQLYAQGIIDNKQFTDIFFERICRCNAIAIKMGKKLLIREHSHSYFFNDIMLNDINSISWIEGKYKKLYKTSPWCLLSVRNPIDSWLGLRQNFPKWKNIDFNTYCGMYINFLNMSKKTENIFIFKYEEMVKCPKRVLIEISKKINLPYIPIDIEKINSIPSSGNSGRCSPELYIRHRRPFTNHFFNTAINSVNYRKLCEFLEYDHLHEQIKSKDKILMLKYTLNNFLFDILSFLRRSVEIKKILD